VPVFDANLVKKVVRIFAYAFIGLYPVNNLIGNLSGSQPIDVTALRAAGAAGVIAVLGFIWNAFVDPSPIPSLAITNEDGTLQ
jgi:hypothetical protein